MTQCIVCAKEDQEMSREHVIPDALGGVYIINTVCKTCNNKMGTTIDPGLINNKIIEFYRDEFKIPGKRNTIPTPLGGSFISEKDPKVRMTFKKDKDGRDYPYYFPVFIQKKDVNENIIGIEVRLDESDIPNRDKLLTEYLSKLNLSIDKLSITEEKIDFHEERFSTQWKINFSKVKIGILKIAYEFASDKIKNFHLSSSSRLISTILLNNDLKGADAFVSLGDGLSDKFIEPFECLLDFESNKHYLILTKFHDGGLVCFVKLHKTFIFGVHFNIPSPIEFQKSIFCINNVTEREVRHLTLIELIQRTNVGTPKLELYSNEVNIETSKPSFELYKIDKKRDLIPLYDDNGKFKAFLHEFLTQPEQLMNKQILSINKMSCFLPVERGDFFAKDNSDEKLIKVTSFCIINNIVKI